MPRPTRKIPLAVRLLVAATLFCGTTLVVPRWWCGLDAPGWYRDGDAAAPRALARQVAATVRRGISEKDFTNDDALFRNEWLFGTYQTGAIGLIQVAAQLPDSPERTALVDAANLAIERVLSAEVRAFDAQKWGADPIDSLEADRGHAAYLGYLNLTLGLHRTHLRSQRWTELNDSISASLARRLALSPHRIIETYPGEAYPIDNSAAVASVLLNARLNGKAPEAETLEALAHYRGKWRDPKTGMLFQAISPDGMPGDSPRASGTALAALWLAHADPALGRELFNALAKGQADDLLGFGYIREYETGGWDKPGDVDSGPLVFGASISATGFCLGTARMFDDYFLFRSLYRTAHLVGTPVGRLDGSLTFTAGGPLGNSLMLMLLTTPRPTNLQPGRQP